MRAPIERHGGTVEKFIGDAVMAVFGVPQVHEDDALRAVRAAVEMRDGARPAERRARRPRAVAARVRIGVNTGEVVTGDGDARPSSPATPSTRRSASRRPPAPGEILIGAPTRRLVENAVELEPARRRSSEGQARAGRGVARARRRSPGAAPFARRLDAPLVGRARELALAARRARGGASATAPAGSSRSSAPPGIGKSRLAAELARAGSPGRHAS